MDKMPKEEIRAGLLKEQYPPQMVDWALEKIVVQLLLSIACGVLLPVLALWNGFPVNFSRR